MLAKSWGLLEPAAQTAGAVQDAAIAQATPDPVLQQAREIAVRMDRTLPDFLCKELVERSENGVEDKLSAEITYAAKSGEDYREIRVNGQPTQKSWAEVGGDVSTRVRKSAP